MPRSNQFEAEYAKSNMATCRVCMAKIPKGALRVGHSQVELENDLTAPGASTKETDDRSSYLAAATRWHHFECFPRMKGAKWMAANLPVLSEVKVVESLKKQDQKRLAQLWKAISAGAATAAPAPATVHGGDGTTEEAAESAKGKKRKAETEISRAKAKAAAKVAKLTSVQGELSAAAYKACLKFEEELSSWTSAQLHKELSANDQVRNGKKEELVQRVAEGRVLGALPSCPRCKKGRIHWSRIGGWYSCPGHYDSDAKMHKRCFWRSQTLKRKKWVKTGKSKK